MRTRAKKKAFFVGGPVTPDSRYHCAEPFTQRTCIISVEEGE